MALSTYVELQAAILAAAHRTGDTVLAAQVPDFILVAEGRFNHELRTREMESSSTITLTSGNGTLPTDYLETIKVISASSPRRRLAYATSDWLEEAYPDQPSADSSFYTILGSTIYTYPLGTSDLDFHYYQKIPDLATNSTNWLLTRAPGVYLYGALVELDLFTADEKSATRHAAALTTELQRFEVSEAFNLPSVPERRAHTFSP